MRDSSSVNSARQWTIGARDINGMLMLLSSILERGVGHAMSTGSASWLDMHACIWYHIASEALPL